MFTEHPVRPIDHLIKYKSSLISVLLVQRAREVIEKYGHREIEREREIETERDRERERKEEGGLPKNAIV